MKIVLFFIAGAFAAQDTTPPVISLSFYGNPSSVWSGAGQCRTYMQWAENDPRATGVADSTGWDSASNACKKSYLNTKATCEAPVAAYNALTQAQKDQLTSDGFTSALLTDASKLKCHWVHKADEVPKWFFEVHHDASGRPTKHADVSKRASVSCIVGGTEQTCPDPKCEKVDHHDNNGAAQEACETPNVVMVRHNVDTQTANAGAITATADTEAASKTAYMTSETNTYNFASPAYTGRHTVDQSTCAGTAQNSRTSPSQTCVRRTILGQYLVTYTAKDAAGNEAEPVAFSFLFVDPFVPHIDLSAHAHNQRGQNDRMLGYPKSLGTYYDVSGTTTDDIGKAIFPGDANHGCGTACAADDLTDGEGKTWGALYSAIGSHTGTRDQATTLSHTGNSGTDFTVDPASGSALSDVTTMASSEITNGNLDFDTTGGAKYDVKPLASMDFEAGLVTAVRYGGFYDVAEKIERDVDASEAFCLYNPSNTEGAGGTAEAAVTGTSAACSQQTSSGACTGACEWHTAATRIANKGKWSYSVVATATDNYRTTTVATDALTVYYQYTSTVGGASATTNQWKTATSASEDIKMTPGLKARIAWFVDDDAGDFGFKQTSNPQTHTIQFYVTDNTRPILMPAQKKTYDAQSLPVGDVGGNTGVGFAVDPRTETDADLLTYGYKDVTCKDINDPTLCQGTCSWQATGCKNTANTANNDAVLESCASKATSQAKTASSNGETTCYGKNKATCWTNSNTCFWTTSKMWQDNQGEKNTGSCPTGLVEYKYRVPTCTTSKAAGKNAKCDTTTKDYFNSGSSFTTHTKCRPAGNTPDHTNTGTNMKDSNAYTVVVECGYAASESVNTGYTEYGARAFDNYDNIKTSDNTYQKIDLFTDGDTTSSACSASVTPLWTSCSPTGSDYANANTNAMGNGGYGALYNTQLKKSAESSSSDSWNLRGLYYRSGLLQNAAQDFFNDFLVVYKYTDSQGNSARPLMRKIVTRDTTAPTITLLGDNTLENSAGSYVHSTGARSADNANTIDECVQQSNRTSTVGCTSYTDATTCNAVGTNCIWSYEDADELSGTGTFDTGRIITYFKHRDDCDKDLITEVTMHSGLCPSHDGSHDSNTVNYGAKLTCTAASSSSTADCFAGVFQYQSAGDDLEKPNESENLLASDSNKMQEFPEWTAGDYSIKYKATDSAGLTAEVCRNILNVDHTFPIIQILGSDQMTLEATHQGNYIDDGATCSDQVDGVISQNVEVSGDVVNLSKVGTYTITYNCKDSANNAAPAARRTVVVAQTSCPRCHMFGIETVEHEASFPYADAGAACSDVIDGTTATKCYATSAVPGFTAVSNNCDTKLVDTETTGTYVIEYRATNTVGLTNTDSNCRGGAIVYKRTVNVLDTLRPVISLSYKNSKSASEVVVAQGTAGNGDGIAADRTTDPTTNVGSGAYPNPDHNGDPLGYPAQGSTNSYLDSNGNYKNQGNFADPETYNYMAEESTSSVNGWVVGAIASAVAGLALLGYSTRRTAVATSVPV